MEFKMNWSFRIAQVAGIDIKVHITFFLILILGAFQWGGSTPGSLEGALFGVVLMILLFTCVTLHELGHSLTAKYFGVPVKDITLLPLGGVAQLTKNPEKPLHEFIIAAAGPLVNVVIAIVLFIVTGASAQLGVLGGRGELLNQLNAPSLQTMLLWLLAANVSLVLFNLIPAFPLDGGRMLRALLAMKLGTPRATRIAALIGQGIAIVLGIVGVLSGNFILALVAVFIFFGAGQENVAAQAKTVLSTQKIGDAYNKHAITLQNGDRVSKVVDYILTSYQPDFAVTFGNNLLGVVTREDVLRTLATNPNDVYVGEIMKREVLKVEAARSLDEVREEMGEKGARLAAVYNGASYLGLVSAEDLNEAIAVLAFVQQQQRIKNAGRVTP
jgi:Zn-dependent protease/predicted transcriptional regulator